MKLTQLKTIVKEAVKEAIQEEMKDILMEAVRSPNQPIYKNTTTGIPTTSTQQTPMPPSDKMAMRENIQNVLGSMMPGANGTISANTNSMPLQMNGPMDTASPNGKLPEGDVPMDMIMGFVKK